MRFFVFSLLVAGCGSRDACDPFPDQTCLSLEVRGPGLTVDQIALHPTSGFADARSPADPGPAYALPVHVAVLPGDAFAGSVELQVRGFLQGILVGTDQIHATVTARQHLS